MLYCYGFLFSIRNFRLFRGLYSVDSIRSVTATLSICIALIYIRTNYTTQSIQTTNDKLLLLDSAAVIVLAY